MQPPTIYRLFGDKQGLLDAVAAHGFAAYLATKTTREPTADPIADLRAGWDLHVGLGLADPALYTLMYTRPGAGAGTPAAVTAFGMLAALIRRIAEAGRLRHPRRAGRRTGPRGGQRHDTRPDRHTRRSPRSGTVQHRTRSGHRRHHDR
ncbi:TetR/AcrR family transcriptional regulator [Nocardia sp. NPDC088792]|uniref:TetR/AcrR family transcriptional regulator n=1 Tax=Nocardia sp. NPDC088792 TaxID=3364332 RepID=UPI0037FE8E94